jgi:hypothetical protein
MTPEHADRFEEQVYEMVVSEPGAWHRPCLRV